MGKIESIKQKIRQLDAGTFQNLCDAYLSKKGYSNIVSLGSEAGTRKTTPGTPDTYFVISGGKYVFVEYTTQKRNLFEKIKGDINKCLDVRLTKIPHKKISEIIYCHTSSNLTPFQDSALRILCSDCGINLNMIGIDEIAEDIYLLYPILADDFLNISVSSNQIFSYEDFIKTYNLNRMAAPIDTKFMFREQELEDISEAFKKVDIVILTGAAGTGKTRLALSYLENNTNINDESVMCIRSNGLSIIKDLSYFVNDDKDYFMFIDDANHLSELKNLIDYVNSRRVDTNVKIIITVRDYALKKMLRDINDITDYILIKVEKFSDDQIRNLLEISLGIRNINYQDRIISIANGNARIAMYAGKVSLSSNKLSSINDMTQLYEKYFGVILNENGLFSNPGLCTTAGIVAFMEIFNLDKEESYLPILESVRITKEDFFQNIKTLHALEIMDVYENKAVRFSEQNFSNYVLKYVFVDEKLLSLAEMIRICFPFYTQRIIGALNTLINIFNNKEVIEFVTNEIKRVWESIEINNSPHLFEFIKAFYSFNPTKTLLVLKDKIDSENSGNRHRDIVFNNEKKNIQVVTNEIVQVLGGFASFPEFPTACDLFFYYCSKRPDLYNEFYQAIKLYYDVNKRSLTSDFYTQITLLKKMKENSNQWQDETVANLFLDIAKDFLQLTYHPTEGFSTHSFRIYNISLGDTPSVKLFRKLLWEYLTELGSMIVYRERIKEILFTYGGEIDVKSKPILEYDLTFITKIVEKNLTTNNLDDCIIVGHIASVFEKHRICAPLLFCEFLEAEEYRLFLLLKGANLNSDVPYEKAVETKRLAIEDHVSQCDSSEFNKLIDLCNKLTPTIKSYNLYLVKEGLDIAFDAISESGDTFVDAVKYYLKSGTPLNLFPHHLIGKLFMHIPALEVFSIIENEEFDQKNCWLYGYYHELPKEAISTQQLKGLYRFLKDDFDQTMVESGFRDLDFLDKYNVVDKDVFIKGCSIIFGRVKHSTFLSGIYFRRLLNIHHNTPQEVIHKFSGNLDLLEAIYAKMLACDHSIDYDGKFLKEFYLVKESFLDVYCDYLSSQTGLINDDYPGREQIFFELNSYLEIYNKIFDQLVADDEHSTIFLIDYLKLLLLKNSSKYTDKKDEWIRQQISKYYNDKMRMYCLFEVISNMEVTRKLDYILLFLEYQPSIDVFVKIPLVPQSFGWTGSIIPFYLGWINYLEILSGKLIGLKWLKHKVHTEKLISHYKEEIKREEIREIFVE